MGREENAVRTNPYEQMPFKTFGKRVKVRVFENPGHRYTNWAFDVVQPGTGRTHKHYMPIQSLRDARKALAEADRFMWWRRWFWWFFKLID